jgi:hypothetical protein
MKRFGKKLSLHRETLQRLVPAELIRAAGGHTNEIVTSCMATKLCGSTGCTSNPCGSAACGSAGCGNTQNTCTLQFVTCCQP